MTELAKSDIEVLYQQGVEAIETITDSFDDNDWNLTACGLWDSTDTVRHLVGVADWYHEWLDRALDDKFDQPFPENEFDERNADRVKNYQELDGPAAVTQFASLAREYLDRASPEWDRPYGFPAGTVTVGLHVGVAATEWHLHGWDLANANNQRHRPEDPGELFRAAGTAISVATGGIRGRFLRMAVPLAAKRSPWETLLSKSGRS